MERRGVCRNRYDRAIINEAEGQVKRTAFIEIILMTYSYVQNAINAEAFPNRMDPFDPSLMTGRGKGKYCYRPDVRAQAEEFLCAQLARRLPGMPILYIA